MKKRQRKKNRKRAIRTWKYALTTSGFMDSLVELYKMDRQLDAALLRLFAIPEAG